VSRSHDIVKVTPHGLFTWTDALLVDWRQQNLAELINEMLSLENRLETLTRRALADDERILGQEKANIVNVLHALVRGFVTMRLRLVDPEKAGEYSATLSVSEDKDGFVVTGKLPTASTDYSLKGWVTGTFEPECERLVASFQTAAKDRELSLAEKIKLVQQIDTMLGQTIQAFYLMRSGDVFK